MKLIFVRHGQSVNNAIYDKTGSSSGRFEDPPLTEIGRIQAEKLAAFLEQEQRKAREDANKMGPKEQITHIYCSLMVRAIQTGTYLSSYLNLPLKAYKDIHEVGGLFRIDEITGEYIGVAGTNQEYFTEEFPELFIPEEISSSGWWNRSFEEVDERYARARRVLQDIQQNHQDDDVVVIVSHRGFYNTLMRVLISDDEKTNTWFEMNNASITKIDFQNQSSIGIIYTNRHEYLPEEYVTI